MDNLRPSLHKLVNYPLSDHQQPTSNHTYYSPPTSPHLLHGRILKEPPPFESKLPFTGDWTP